MNVTFSENLVTTFDNEPAISIHNVEEKIKDAVSSRRVRADEYFKDFDRLRTGQITKAQFDRCLAQHCGIILNDIESGMLMHKYSSDDDKVNYREFCTTIDAGLDSQPAEQKPHSSVVYNTSLAARSLSSSSLSRCNEIIERIAPYYKYHGINIKSSYSDFDLHNIGLVTESQFYRTFPGPPNVDESEQALLARRYAHATKPEMCNYLDFHQDMVNAISHQNDENNIATMSHEDDYRMVQPFKSTLDGVFDKIRKAVHKNGIRTTEFFKDHDKLRSGIITNNQFVCGLSLCCGTQADLSRDEIELLTQFYQTEDGRVRYREFCHLMENAFNVPYLEKNPTVDVYRPPTGALAKLPNVLSEQEEQACQKVIEGLRDVVRKKRVMLYSYFKDFDRGFCTTRGITKSQFSRMLHMVGLNTSHAELELLCRKFEYPVGGDINYPAFVQAIDAEYCGRARVTGDWNTTNTFTKKTGWTMEDNTDLDVSSIDVDELVARIRHHVLINRIRVEEFFQDFDPLRHGSIIASRFRMGLNAMGQKHLSEAQILAIINRYADHSRKGNVLWTKFFSDIDKVFTQRGLEKTPTAKLPPLEKYYVPKPGSTDWTRVTGEEQETVEQIISKMRQKVSERRILTRPCFQDFDRHNYGYVTRSQLHQCMTYLCLDARPDEIDLLFKKFGDSTGFNYHNFLNELQPHEQEEQKYAKRLETLHLVNSEKNLKIAPKNISDVMTKIKTKVVKETVRVIEFMRDYDKLRTGRMLKTSFPRALDLCALGLSIDEINTVMDWYSSSNHEGYVDYYRFCDDVEMCFTQKGLEKNPTLVPVQFKPDSDLNVINILPECKEMLELVLHRLADRVRVRRIQLFPLFEDYDRVHNGTVSRSQFRRVLSELELESLVSDREFQLLYEQFDSIIGGKHDFNYSLFCDTLNNYALFDPNVP